MTIPSYGISILDVDVGDALATLSLAVGIRDSGIHASDDLSLSGIMKLYPSFIQKKILLGTPAYKRFQQADEARSDACTIADAFSRGCHLSSRKSKKTTLRILRSSLQFFDPIFIIPSHLLY